MKWIKVLAAECEKTSQAKVASKLGVSATVVNQCIHNKYPGDRERIKNLVEGAYMNHNVICPVLGKIPKNICMEHQQRPFAATNPQRVQLYRACHNGCKFSEVGERDHG